MYNIIGVKLGRQNLSLDPNMVLLDLALMYFLDTWTKCKKFSTGSSFLIQFFIHKFYIFLILYRYTFLFFYFIMFKFISII